MQEFPTVWNIFHDGNICRLEGQVPGTVTVFVDVEYLRERFSESGDCFVVTLHDCLEFSYQLYDDENLIVDFAAIEDAWPSILSAEMEGDVCKVFAGLGVLKVRSSSCSLQLDSGREVSLAELQNVATEYWAQWKARSSADKQD